LYEGAIDNINLSHRKL